MVVKSKQYERQTGGISVCFPSGCVDPNDVGSNCCPFWIHKSKKKTLVQSQKKLFIYLTSKLKIFFFFQSFIFEQILQIKKPVKNQNIYKWFLKNSTLLNEFVYIAYCKKGIVYSPQYTSTWYKMCGGCLTHMEKLWAVNICKHIHIHSYIV